MKKFCTHCGKELENLESLNFCSFCGGNLKNQKEKNTKVDKISHIKEFKSSNTNYNFKRFEDFEDKYKEKEKEVLNTYTFEAHKKENQEYLKQTKKRGLIVFLFFIITLYLTSGGRSNDFSTLINSILWIGFFVFILYVIFIFVTMFLHGNSKEFYQEELEKKKSLRKNYRNVKKKKKWPIFTGVATGVIAVAALATYFDNKRSFISIDNFVFSRVRFLMLLLFLNYRCTLIYLQLLLYLSQEFLSC